MVNLADTMLRWSGQPDPTMLDEITGKPVRRDVFGNVVEYGWLNPKPQPTAREYIERGQNYGIDPIERGPGLGEATSTLARALYEGAMQGITAPRRALDGETTTLGDAWATALDWGMMSPLGSAPKGALRAGYTRFADPEDIKLMYPDEEYPASAWVTAEDAAPKPPISSYVDDPNQYNLALNELEVQRIDDTRKLDAALEDARLNDDAINSFIAVMNKDRPDLVLPEMMARADELGLADTILAQYPDTRMHLVAPHPSGGMETVYHWTRGTKDRFPYFDRTRHGITQAHDRLGAHVGTEAAAEARMAAHGDKYVGMDGVTTDGRMLELRADTSRPFTREEALKWVTDRLGTPDEPGYAPKMGYDPAHHVGTLENWIKDYAGDPNWTEAQFERFLDWTYRARNGRFSDYPAQAANETMRFGDDLAQAGYTNVPYYNAIEDPGSVSHIMLVDKRPLGEPRPVLRYDDARFDPRFSHLPNLMAGAIPFSLGLSEMAGQQPRSDRKE